MFYYTYVLSSLKTNQLYIGWTTNFTNPSKNHNQGLVKATKSGIPWKLIYYEACLNKQDAIKREKQLKTGFGRAYLKRRLSDY